MNQIQFKNKMIKLGFFNTRLSSIKWMAAVYMAFLGLVVFSVNTGIGRPIFKWVKTIPEGDKMIHFMLVGLLAFVLNVYLKNRVIKFGNIDLMKGGLIASAIFTLEEFSQLFLDGRTFSLADAFANYCGVFLFSKLALLAEPYLLKTK